MKEFAGKSVLITGGAQGLGKEIAHTFARQGANISIMDIQPMEHLQTEFQEYGITLITASGDINRQEDCNRFVNASLEKLGSIDILVNNTGVGGPVQSVANVDIDEWEQALDINLTGTIRCTQAVLQVMIAGKSGCIVNIASNVAKRGLADRSAYVVSNWGKIGLTQTLALELAPFGIRVNAVCPGPIEGPRVESFFKKMAQAAGKTYDEVVSEELSLSAMHRMVLPREVADVVLFLASQRASAMTGQSINVTAGMVMH